MNKLILKIRSSLFTKIILIFGSAILIFIVIFIFTNQFFFKKKIMPRVIENSTNYSSLIIDKLGGEPDTLRAKHLAEKFNVQIGIRNDSLNWASNPEMKTLSIDGYRKAAGKENIWYAMDSGLHIVIRRGNTRFCFSMEPNHKGFSYYAELLLIINILYFLGIVSLIYYLMKREFKPLELLSDGVRSVSRGDFSGKFRTSRSDELGRLIDSFSEMNNQVNEMIKARERLLVDVSHEMRSPLTRIRLALEMIDDEELRNSIKEDISDLEKMITEILEEERLGSKYGGLNISEFDFNEIIGEVEYQYSSIKPGLKINKPEETLIIEADSERLRLLLRNLIENAQKYSSESIHPVELTAEINGNELIVSVKDYGPGIPKESIELIFEPFYRVDKSRTKSTGGYGLGLHLCKNIVQAHGGTIKVISGKSGAVFTARIPVKRRG